MTTQTAPTTAAEAAELTLPGTDRPLPGAALRAARERTVLGHAMAQATGDVDGILAAFPRGVVYRILPFEEQPLVRPDQIRGYLDGMREAFPDMEHRVAVVHHTADAVILEGAVAGTQAAEWRGIPSRGKRMEVPVAVFFHFDGDVLVDETIYYDHATAARQLA
ncbi:ester cyclase [Streptomyces sp. YIM 98790]|uniref:ester cyclase n=1 Tax=Streptomyces sp. YIM 98790 TaxID=2689077 RepID=UPI0014085E02|nr:ester cyclase [Streptomyces sp. YIM 98790]